MRLKVTVISLVCVFLFGACVSRGSQLEDYTTGGRVVSDAATDADGVTRILVYYDMEGISGQNDIRTISFGNEEYAQARVWLTNDVNAVVDGLFAGGADEVVVVDAHGSGNPEPDILVDQMDTRATLMDRADPFRPYIDLTEVDLYDAVAVVCMHASTGAGGFGSHTYTLGMDWIFNDMRTNETEIIAYAWGQVGVPVIFASGDDKLAQQLEWMDWLEYTTVKNALAADDAELIPFDNVHAEMRVDAARAVENIESSKAVVLTTPIQAQLRAVPPAALNQLDGVPGIDYQDQTVTFLANDFLAAYDGIEALIGVATGSYSLFLNEVLSEQNNSATMRELISERLFGRWVDVESGRWNPPASASGGSGDRRYFGVR